MAATTTHKLPKKSANVEARRRSLAALSSGFSRQFDFLGGRGSVIFGTGTSNLGFFVSW